VPGRAARRRDRPPARRADPEQPARERDQVHRPRPCGHRGLHRGRGPAGARVGVHVPRVAERPDRPAGDRAVGRAGDPRPRHRHRDP
jgi:hypothetical protein